MTHTRARARKVSLPEPDLASENLLPWHQEMEALGILANVVRKTICLMKRPFTAAPTHTSPDFYFSVIPLEDFLSFKN